MDTVSAGCAMIAGVQVHHVHWGTTESELEIKPLLNPHADNEQRACL
jgi:hypothetical protein